MWRQASEAGVRPVMIVVGATCRNCAAGMAQRREQAFVEETELLRLLGAIPTMQQFLANRVFQIFLVLPAVLSVAQ